MGQLEEQLTTARNDVMKLRQRVDELEQAKVAAPVASERPSAALPGLAFELPRTRAGDENEAVAVLVVTEASLVLDGEVITDGELDDALRERARDDPNTAFNCSCRVSFARL